MRFIFRLFMFSLCGECLSTVAPDCNMQTTGNGAASSSVVVSHSSCVEDENPIDEKFMRFFVNLTIVLCTLKKRFQRGFK